MKRAGPLAVLLVLAGALAGATRLRSYDLFWHLATGKHILESGAVPRGDPFSFTAAGTPWVDHSWLFQVVLWGAWDLAGMWGPWILKLGCAAALAALLVRHLLCWRVPPAATAVVVLVALQGMHFRLMFRPELATLLLAALAAHLLCPVPGRRARWTPLWLVPLTVLWINTHGGGIVAPLLLAACLAGALAGRWLDPGRPALPGSWWLALAGSVLALGVNPYGAEVLAVPFRLHAIVGQPWADNPEWAWPPDPRVFPLLYLACAALVILAVRRLGRLEPSSLALGTLGFGMAFFSVRNVGLFFVLMPFAAAPLLAGARTWGKVRPAMVHGLVLAGMAWLAWAPAWLALAPRGGMLGAGLEPGRYPVHAVEFLEREAVPSRLFNEVAFGGYLIWHFPERPVFIDGRNEIYAELLQQIHAGMGNVQSFWELTRRWQLDAALLRYPAQGMVVGYPQPGGGRRDVVRSWSEVFFPRREWALVYWDDTAMVRVRRDAVEASWLDRNEFRHLNPDDWAFLRDEMQAGRVAPADLLRDLERTLSRHPGCHRALRLQDEIRALMEKPWVGSHAG